MRPLPQSRVGAVLALLILFAGCETGEPGPRNSEDTSARFDQSVFASTHNSYSGATRGSIRAQLDAGVRFVEFDVWDDLFDAEQDLHLGHDAIGHEVALGDGNPDQARLSLWLALVDAWSDAHPTHGPLVVSLDLKSDMTGNEESGATPDAIDNLLTAAFDNKLWTPGDLRNQGDIQNQRDAARWPTVRALEGRIVVMISGHGESRAAYQARAARVAFTDFQKADPIEHLEAFVGVRTGEGALLKNWSGPGRLHRIWRFGDEPTDYDFRVHFPATDRPFSETYSKYCQKYQCVQ